MSYLLTPAEFAASKVKVTALNARAVKRGWTGRVEIAGERLVIQNTGSPRPFPDLPAAAEVVRFETTITGAAPCYNSWRFLAALDGLPAADQSVSWVLRYAPGVEEVAIDRTRLRAGACDHCQTIRGNRRHLYAVEHIETGEIRQVGSSCIRDFFGWNTAPVFISCEDTLNVCETTRGAGEAWTPGYVVWVALAAVDVAGWTSRQFAGPGRVATAELVSAYLAGTGRSGQAARELLDPAMTAAGKLEPDVMATVRAEVGEAQDGYSANLSAALAAEQAGPQQIGLLASTVACYHRILADRADQHDEGQGEPEPVWLAEPGVKVEIAGTILTAMTVDGYAYNTSQRLIVVQAGPTLAKMYTAAAWAYDVSAGDPVNLRATVKSHDLWQGHQQTVLTRAKQIPTTKE